MGKKIIDIKSDATYCGEENQRQGGRELKSDSMIHTPGKMKNRRREKF